MRIVVAVLSGIAIEIGGIAMYLTGSYKHNLDAKSRVTLPSSFRKQLGDTLCLVPLSDCVLGFTPESHKTWIESFFPGGINPRNRRDVQLKAALLARTISVDVDSAGRLALSKLDEKTRSRLGIAHELAIVGVDDHLEIWNAERFEEQMENFDDNIDALMFDE